MAKTLKQDRLGTKHFCSIWRKAGAATTTWEDKEDVKPKDRKGFVHTFQKLSGFADYPAATIKSRIADYEKDLKKARKTSLIPKYPKERTASCVAFFVAEEKENAKKTKKEK